MSTKIYGARRLKPGVKLWSFAASVRTRAEKHISEELTEWYHRMLEQAEDPMRRQSLLELLKLGLEHTGPITAYHFSNWINLEFKAQSIRSMCDPFGMDVSVVFYEHKGRIYFIPCANGMMSETLNFLRKDSSSEDFHYQNQCDKSADCSDTAWERRGKTWEAMTTPDGHLANGLVLELLSPMSFFLLDYKVREKLRKTRSTT